MLERLRQSLALRLAIQYAVVFVMGSAVLFGVLYLVLASALEQRDQSAIAQRASDLANVFETGGIDQLRARLDSDTSPNAQSYFVRLVRPDQLPVFVKVPPNWITTQVQRIPFGLFAAELKTQVVRVPQNALRDYTIASHPLPDGWLIQVGRITDSKAVLLAPVRRAFIGVGAGALCLSIAMGTILAWRSTRPLRAVSDTARRILETGDLTARVPGPNGRGELAELVRQLNSLLDRNSAHVKVLRETLDNLAHDMRTPLTRLRGTAELALQDAGDPAEARTALAECVDESDRVLHLLETLLDISAAEAGALKLNLDRLDLRSLLGRASDLYREVADEKRIVVNVEGADPVELGVDAIRLGQAVNNLLDNALKYTPPGGKVSLWVRSTQDAVLLGVADTGPGVPTAEREAIFRRLYRGDASRSQRGLGLGLSMVKAIVEAHGGSVIVDDAPGGGAQFTIRLPRQ